MRTVGTHSEFRCNPWEKGQQGVAQEGPKSILYKHSHVADKIKGNEELNTVVQKFCPGVMSRGHQRSKGRILGPFFFIFTQLLGFLS